MKIDIDLIDIGIKITKVAKGKKNPSLGSFNEIAFIFDQENLLKDIRKIRILWHLDKSLIAFEKFNEWLAQPHYNFLLSHNAHNHLAIFQDRLELDKLHNLVDEEKYSRLSKKIAYLDPQDFELEFLLKIHNLEPHLKKLLLKAIVCGVVRDEDLNYKNNKNEFNYSELLDSPEFSFIPKKNYKNDTKSEIDRDREWYRLKRKGLSYRQIAKIKIAKLKHKEYSGFNLKSSKEDSFRDKIKSQLRRYKNFLKGGTFSKK